jgi:dihydrolipoamide dehydrogenase
MHYTISNATNDKRRVVEFAAIPHTIFTESQLAGVGSTESATAFREWNQHGKRREGVR